MSKLVTNKHSIKVVCLYAISVDVWFC